MEAIEIRDGCTLISVWDMPTSVRFYRELLGFEIVQRSPTYATENGEELFHWCMMKSNAACLMLNTDYDEGQRPAARPGRHQRRIGAKGALAGFHGSINSRPSVPSGRDARPPRRRPLPAPARASGRGPRRGRRSCRCRRASAPFRG